MGADVRAGDVLAAALRRNARALLDQDVAVRRRDVDAVHQLRVTCRRLRADLWTFRPVLDRDWSDALREELAWLASALGQARDAEVLRERLQAAVEVLPAERARVALMSRLSTALIVRTEAADAVVDDALGSPRYGALVARLLAASPRLGPLADTPARKALGPRVAAVWKRLDRAADAGLAADAPDELLHVTRVVAKRARYAAESVVPAFGKRARRLAARAERVQEVLGEQHDAVVAATFLEDLARPVRSGREAFLLGGLHQRQLDRAAQAAREFRDVWRTGAPQKMDWLRP